jgi:hypothetical protein
MLYLICVTGVRHTQNCYKILKFTEYQNSFPNLVIKYYVIINVGLLYEIQFLNFRSFATSGQVETDYTY